MCVERPTTTNALALVVKILIRGTILDMMYLWYGKSHPDTLLHRIIAIL